MKAKSTSIRISSIFFDNTDTKVLIKGETFKNHLSYPSEMFISFNELNVLLNYLQKQNPSVSISELFQEEALGYEYVQTSMDASALENAVFDRSIFSFTSDRKLVRA